MQPIKQHWSELDEETRRIILLIHTELAARASGRTARAYLLDQARQGRRDMQAGSLGGAGRLTHAQRQLVTLRYGEHIWNPAQGHANETPAEFARNVDTLWHMSAGWR